jgi:hypothetical protein
MFLPEEEKKEEEDRGFIFCRLFFHNERDMAWIEALKYASGMKRVD